MISSYSGKTGTWEKTSMIGSFRSPQALFLALLAAFDAQAQPGDTPAQVDRIIRPMQPVWLLEQPFANNPLLTARTFGDSAYGEYHVKATLQISCHSQTHGASVTLQIAPRSLGFHSDPFEGPDAAANGPMHITMGNRPTLELRVSGFWTSAGAFQVGSIFAIQTHIPRDELAYLASDASRNQPLKLSLVPAKAGAKPLTAEFSLPQSNDGLKQVIQPCL
ncbi:hypothetical protein [Pseudomonas sp. R37(2017)]|uniref:hypothetical protein n=1 Tax=Pseudomonas sp. R37(2017) TaxID=1981685 RepID=UPI00117AD4E4|nr:hypothetical protein [Pseudomonas sp. R37(2017)]